MSDTVIILAELQPKPERRDAFLAYARENLPICRGYPGNVRFDVLIESDGGDGIFFYEEWRSAADQQAYMAWRTDAGDFVTLLEYLAAPPRFLTMGDNHTRT